MRVRTTGDVMTKTSELRAEVCTCARSTCVALSREQCPKLPGNAGLRPLELKIQFRDIYVSHISFFVLKHTAPFSIPVVYLRYIPSCLICQNTHIHTKRTAQQKNRPYLTPHFTHSAQVIVFSPYRTEENKINVVC